MDLRRYINRSSQIERVRDLALRGLFFYQPFIFTDTLQTGVGLEFENEEFDGLIYWPDCPDEHLKNESFSRFLVDNKQYEIFKSANNRLRVTYEYFIDEICVAVGDVERTTFVDVGTNLGYFPVSLAKRGALKTVGFDSVDYSETFSFLNSLLHTNSEFHFGAYSPEKMVIPRCGKYDVAIAMHVLTHLSDPLHFLNFLGTTARKAVFLWNHVSENNDNMAITHGDSNRYYPENPFPFSFDFDTRLSVKLLYRCFELMGFRDIREIQIPEGGLIPKTQYEHKAFLAIRR